MWYCEKNNCINCSEEEMAAVKLWEKNPKNKDHLRATVRAILECLDVLEKHPNMKDDTVVMQFKKRDIQALRVLVANALVGGNTLNLKTMEAKQRHHYPDLLPAIQMINPETGEIKEVLNGGWPRN